MPASPVQHCLYYATVSNVCAPVAHISFQYLNSSVGEIQRGENLIEISPLRADRSYTLRLHSISSGNVSTASLTTRFQTSTSGKSDGSRERNGPAKVRVDPLRTRTPPNHSSPKESVPSAQAAPKSVPGRRSYAQSHASVGDLDEWNPASDSEEGDSVEIVQSLTQRLEDLKRQKEEVSTQIEDEENDAKIAQGVLLRNRDQLKIELKEKEDISNELRKQGNNLEKLSRTAQSKKAARERILIQRRTERQRTAEDIQRWTLDSRSIGRHIEMLTNEIESLSTSHQEQMQDFQSVLDGDQSAIRGIEEEIRLRGSNIKDLEQKHGTSGAVGVARSSQPSGTSKDESGRSRIQALQARLQAMWHALNQSRLEERFVEERLSSLAMTQEKAREDSSTVPLGSTQLSAPRRSLQPGGSSHTRACTHPPSVKYFSDPIDFDPVVQYNAISDALPSFDNLSQMTDGIDEYGHLSTSEPTQEGHLSPAANDLLPSYLLGDEEPIKRPQIQGGLEAQSTGRFAGHVFPYSEATGSGTSRTADSRLEGGTASPESSLQNVASLATAAESISNGQLHTTQKSDDPVGTLPQSSSKFANFFSSPFGRQRGKSQGPEPPALGALKQGQSQSFPRNVVDEVNDVPGLRRRRGSHGAWPNPVAGLIGKAGTQTHDDGARTKIGSGRSGRLSVLRYRPSMPEAGDGDDIEYINSRPSSTYSYDHQFSRPSSDSPNIWGPTDNLVRRDSPMNMNWSGAAGPWTRNPSRRASIQHGSSTNISLVGTPLISADAGRIQSKPRPEQAPIGTRPSLPRNLTPKLNPAAPSFKTLFSRSDNKKASKAEKATKQKAAAIRSRDDETSHVDAPEAQDEVSPPASRLSKDAHSITTTTSVADSHDSFERSVSGISTDSPIPKESLMQKITRKSSSSKFNVPWSKERGIFAKRTGDPASSETISDALSEEPATETPDGSPNIHREEKVPRAWTSIRRKPKQDSSVADQDSCSADE